MKKQRDGLTHVSNILPGLVRQIKGPTPIERRLIEGAALPPDDGTSPRDILYQHTVLCQTCLPFRDPGDKVRIWERLNGGVRLKVRAGDAMHPDGHVVELGLPFGPKARMILMHINQIALQQKTPDIEIQDSLTKFVRRTLNLDPKGRNMRMVKDQLSRLSASDFWFGIVKDGRALSVKSQIVTAFDLWFPKDERQRVLWPSIVRLSLDYWESLKAHAVPLDEDHIARLSHSALALDIYAWLANRLHRIPPNRPVPISWAALHAQFGQGYNRVNNFRAAFRVALKEVRTLYRAARIEEPEKPQKPWRTITPTGEIIVREAPSKGLLLYNSPPPISPRS